MKTTSKPGWAGVRASLRERAEPSRVAFYTTSAPTRGKVLGIPVPTLRAMVKSFAAEHKGLTVAQAVQLADIAFESGCREEMLFATFLLTRFKTRLTAEHWPSIDVWIDRIDNWEACDQLAGCVAGEMIGRADDKPRAAWVADLETWAGSKNPWRRRFAAATTTVLNQKGRSDAATALRICERLISDEEKTVQKAVGWALREACKSDPGAVLALLKRHQATMPRTLLRESAQKLTAQQRKALGLT